MDRLSKDLGGHEAIQSNVESKYEPCLERNDENGLQDKKRRGVYL